MKLPGIQGKALAVAGYAILAALYLAFLRFFSEAALSVEGVAFPVIFTGITILIGGLSLVYLAGERHWILSKVGLAFSILGICGLAISVATRDTILSVVALALFYGLALAYSWMIMADKHAIIRWVLLFILAAVMGALPVALVQVLNRFSDEEFFVALQAASLSLYWLLLWVALNKWKKSIDLSTRPAFVRINRPVFLTLAGLLLVGFISVAFYAYQHSFYPAAVPGYAGVSEQQPFLCGDAADPVESASSVNASNVYEKYLADLAGKPQKSVSDEAALYLGTGDDQWAQAFHEDLMKEAGERLFTQPANSVKSIQYDAALRVYYYTQMKAADPNLFTPEEQAQVQQWFQQINQRALTVEWVDWLYALAFSKMPEGPYENQENGAGLLALIEKGGYADPQLSAKNQEYLANNPRGWQARFRNTDDAIIYQPEWLNNALFQSMFTGKAPPLNMSLSFEWLMLQALPDGRSPQYNHPSQPYLMGSFYLGASLLKDGQLLWLADKALDSMPADRVMAQPGAEQPLDLTGNLPTVGSCLLYGDSGLPNQVGPLAPDKIVFRDGWNVGDAYLLLNLRFTGWHRYKATNSIVVLDEDGPLVSEDVTGSSFKWLPTGRSLFRDKRIPRENLNGFLVGRQGMDEALYLLTGIGGPWAQDPPFYATVQSFKTGQGLDYARTSLTDWNGWNQTRSIFFYHNGPIVVYDEAQGPSNQAAALSWHVAGRSEGQDNRFALDNGKQQMEMVMLPQSQGGIHLEAENGAGDQAIIYQAPSNGSMQLITVFLDSDWAGAEVTFQNTQGEATVKVQKNGNLCSIPLREPGQAELSQSCSASK